MERSFLIFTFLKARHENNVQVKVTGSRRLENGFVVPRSFLARTTSRAITTKFEEEIIRLKELCTHMDITQLRNSDEDHCFCNTLLRMSAIKGR